MNFINTLAQNVLAPLVREVVLAQFGCTVTVMRKAESLTADGGVTDVYAADAAATGIAAAIMDPEAATRAKVYGLVEGSTAMMIIPRVTGGMVAIGLHDGIRVDSGPYAGTTFLADTKGAPGVGVVTTVPLSEAALVLA